MPEQKPQHETHHRDFPLGTEGPDSDIVGLYTELQRYAIHDGPGIRTTVFLKGCPLRCSWCHNPENQQVQPEMTFLPERCIRCGLCTQVCLGPDASGSGDIPIPGRQGCLVCGRCVEACAAEARQLLGRSVTMRDLVALVQRDRPFYDESGGGVTFSGGEPLLQGDFLLACLEGLQQQEIHTAVDTCGFADKELILQVARRADLFLYDLKLMDDAAHRRHTGAELGVVLENLRALDEAGAALWIRVPVIPGINDGEENVSAIGRFVSSLGRAHPVHLLPFHSLGADKHRRRNLPYSLGHLEPPSLQVLQQVGAVLADFGLETNLKGCKPPSRSTG